MDSNSFEQGPIRPPSEARSLLVRVARNCPWNKCTFCPVYKRRKYSKRSLEEVLADIEVMEACAEQVRERSLALGFEGEVSQDVVYDLLENPAASRDAKTIAVWLFHGGRTVFLQDANAVLARQEVLLGVLGAIRDKFPHVERVTSYARGHTLARKSVEELTALRQAGLSRIHVGLETGHDPLLKRVRKGGTAEDLIEGGKRVRQAGIHLCFYVMPGLGGRAMSEGHALDSARVVREVDPDRVRLRSLVVHPRTPLADQVAAGDFETLPDEEMVDEIGLFVSGLEGCTGDLVSDHDLNLLMELQGSLADEHPKLLGVVERFRQLPERDKQLFIIGRRTHLMHSLDDLDDPTLRARAAQLLDRLVDELGGDVNDAIQALRERMV